MSVTYIIRRVPAHIIQCFSPNTIAAWEQFFTETMLVYLEGYSASTGGPNNSRNRRQQLWSDNNIRVFVVLNASQGKRFSIPFRT